MRSASLRVLKGLAASEFMNHEMLREKAEREDAENRMKQLEDLVDVSATSSLVARSPSRNCCGAGLEKASDGGA